MKHTKLPWKTSWWIPRQGRKIMANNRCVAIVQTNKKGVLEADPKAEANAEYIVRACNVFPALQVAVEAAIIDFDVTMKMPASYDRGCRIGEIIGGLERASKAALAAGGE